MMATEGRHRHEQGGDGMRLASASTLAFWIAVIPLGGTAMAAEIKGASRIETVTVFPQGAEVTRITKLRLERGEHAILLQDLPGQAIATSIRVEGKATGALQIGSVDARRTLVVSGDPAVAQSARKRLEDEIERQRDQRNELETMVQTAETQKAYLANLAKLPTTPVSPGAPGVAREDWNGLFALIGTRMTEAAKTVSDARLKQRDIDKRIADLQKELASTAPKQQDRIEVRVNATAAAPLEATLTIRYQVPSAAWTPFYDVRLATGDKAVQPKLSIARRALIQQSTGEDWDEVALALSTTRPGRGTAAPELQTVRVEFEEPPRPVAMSAPAPAPAMQKEGRVRTMAPQADMAAGAPAAPPAEQAAVETKAQASIAPFQAVFEVPGRQSVKSAGESKRVQIMADEVEPQLIVRTAPRRDATAYLYTKFQAPKAGVALLPGQVSLFRDGTFVGQGRIPLLNPGEDHELGFGADDAVKVKYATLEEKQGQSGIISSSKTDERNYRITVTNTHDRKIEVTVLDQLPIAGHEEIKVEMLPRSTPPSKRDVEERRGVYSWVLPMNAGEEKQVTFGYRIVWPGDKRIVVR
jgi:uncharacterized protein (TIGR02231 family)